MTLFSLAALLATHIAVIPAQTGTHQLERLSLMGSRLRGDNGREATSSFLVPFRKTDGEAVTGGGKPTPPAKPDPAIAKVAAQFEALFVAQMLKSARAASLGDDLTGKGGATFTDLADQLRAEALAKQAPLGVARILAAVTATPKISTVKVSTLTTSPQMSMPNSLASKAPAR